VQITDKETINSGTPDWFSLRPYQNVVFFFAHI